LNTASCCRSTRIYTFRFARGRKAAMSAPSRAETIAITTGNGDADRGVRHERIAAADRVESAAPRSVSSHHSLGGVPEQPSEPRTSERHGATATERMNRMRSCRASGRPTRRTRLQLIHPCASRCAGARP
jgi:hypothetical protein